jgi:hypothetical protein
MELSCPSCGAPVAFRSTLSVEAVCGSCRSLLARRDVGLERIGSEASVPYDLSPIRVGTRGRADEGRFEVVGRLKRGWEDGLWNEWVITFAGQRWAWLAEAQGLWSILHPVEMKSPPERKKVGIGRKFGFDVEVGGRKQQVGYVTTDIKETTILAVEGELPGLYRTGAETLCVDWLGPKGTCATVEYGEGNPEVFMGRFYEADELKLEQLRTLDGWRL